MSEAFNWQRFNTCPIVGILRGFTREQCIRAAVAAADGGLRAIEATMNTEGAAEIVGAIRDAVGDRMNVGMGTVCNVNDLEAALKSGAQFIVTPIVAMDVLMVCKARGVVIFAGAMTPTEIYHAHSAGAAIVKIFPSEHLGPEYIRSIKRPLDKIKLMPTGGVTPQTLASFHAAGADAYGVGGSLFDGKRIAAGDWKWITAQARALVEAYQRAVSERK